MRKIFAVLACFVIIIIYLFIGVLLEWKHGGGLIPLLILISIIGATWRGITKNKSGHNKNHYTDSKINWGDDCIQPEDDAYINSNLNSNKNQNETLPEKSANYGNKIHTIIKSNYFRITTINKGYLRLSIILWIFSSIFFGIIVQIDFYDFSIGIFFISLVFYSIIYWVLIRIFCWIKDGFKESNN